MCLGILPYGLLPYDIGMHCGGFLPFGLPNLGNNLGGCVQLIGDSREQYHVGGYMEGERIEVLKLLSHYVHDFYFHLQFPFLSHPHSNPHPIPHLSISRITLNHYCLHPQDPEALQLLRSNHFHFHHNPVRGNLLNTQETM